MLQVIVAHKALSLPGIKSIYHRKFHPCIYTRVNATKNGLFACFCNISTNDYICTGNRLTKSTGSKPWFLFKPMLWKLALSNVTSQIAPRHNATHSKIAARNARHTHYRAVKQKWHARQQTSQPPCAFWMVPKRGIARNMQMRCKTHTQLKNKIKPKSNAR